jgi:NitT/TauT family transport system substrate-binding protein
MKRTFFIVMVFVMALTLLGACAPAEPQVIEKEVVVEKEVEVVVTQIVEVEGETVIQEVMVTVEPEAEAPPLRDVNVQLGWIKNSEYAGLFMAEQLGYYEEVGLDVTFISGGAGINPISIVRQNPDFIGINSSNPSLVNAQAAGYPLVSIAAFYQKHPNGFLFLKDSGIEGYEDFVGKTIGVQAEGEYLLDVILALNDIDKSEIEVVRVGYDPTPLLTGQIDAYMAWVVNQPLKAEQEGLEWDFLFFSDNPGIASYAMLPIVHQTLLDSDPEMVQDWLCATLKGWEYTLDNPEEVAQIVVDEYLPASTFEAEMFLLTNANPITVSEDTAEHGLGWSDPVNWEELIETLVTYEQVDSAPAVEDIMTNEFVEACGILR